MAEENESNQASTSETEKAAMIEKQIKEMMNRGYKREQLWVTPDGRVLVEMDGDDMGAYNRAKLKKEKDS